MAETRRSQLRLNNSTRDALKELIGDAAVEASITQVATDFLNEAIRAARDPESPNILPSVAKFRLSLRLPTTVLFKVGHHGSASAPVASRLYEGPSEKLEIEIELPKGLRDAMMERIHSRKISRVSDYLVMLIVRDILGDFSSFEDVVTESADGTWSSEKPKEAKKVNSAERKAPQAER